MAETPKKTTDWEITLLPETDISRGKPTGQSPGPVAGQSAPVEKPARPAPGAGLKSVRAGFASWPEIPGHDKCNVGSLHAQLLFTQWMTPGILQHLQLKQIENMLRHARKQAPFYLDRLDFLDRLPPGALSEEHFSNLRLLTRQQLQEFSEEIISRNWPDNHGPSRTMSNASSNDVPARVKGTGFTELWARAMNLRVQDWHGLDGSLVNLDVCDVLKGKKTKTGRWSELPWSGPSTALSIDRPIEHLFKDFIRIRPHYLQTRPSVLLAFAELSKERGTKPRNLCKVVCRGGYLGTDIRSKVEEAWGVPVVHLYSAPEVGVMAIQCPQHGHLHVQSEHIRLEVLDNENLPCRPGESGRVVVTTLHNYQTPLVRYANGDFAEMGETCDCGRNLPVLKLLHHHA